MKIIILGAGQVGSNLAESLVAEDNDITVIDLDLARLALLQDRFDLRTVRGHAAHPSVLKKAGADDADMLVAVTQSDETNLVACRLAATLFNIPSRIARIRSTDFLEIEREFLSEHFGVDHIISPEHEVTETLRRLIEHPEALQVLDFADGKVRLVAVRAYHGGPLVGHELQDLRRHMPDIDCRVAAIYRRDRGIVPKGITVIEPGDEVFFLARLEDIPAVMRELRRMERPVKRVMIAGGGNIGRQLAARLERDYEVKLVEINKAASNQLAEKLHRTLVLTGDATDEDLLEQENIESMDVFCALTNDDEDNIMSALLAKRMGAHRVMALDQPLGLRQSGAGRRDRHCHLAGTGHGGALALENPSRRHGRSAQPAARRGRGARDRHSWRPENIQGGGAAYWGCGLAGWLGDCRHHSWRRGADCAPRYLDGSRRPSHSVCAQQAHHPQDRKTVSGWFRLFLSVSMHRFAPVLYVPGLVILIFSFTMLALRVMPAGGPEGWALVTSRSC